MAYMPNMPKVPYVAYLAYLANMPHDQSTMTMVKPPNSNLSIINNLADKLIDLR